MRNPATRLHRTQGRPKPPRKRGKLISLVLPACAAQAPVLLDGAHSAFLLRFHAACWAGRHTAQGRYPAAMAVASSAKNTRCFTYPPWGDGTQRRRAVQPPIELAGPVSPYRPGVWL